MDNKLPSLRPKPDLDVSQSTMKEGPYGTVDVMTYGIAATKDKLSLSHPLEYSEKHYRSQQEKLDLAMLQRTQGLHMPLRLQMERKAAKSVGHLPFLPRSNLMHDVLTGRDENIGFEDFLNNPADSEIMGQPHAMVEKELGLL